MANQITAPINQRPKNATPHIVDPNVFRCSIPPLSKSIVLLGRTPRRDPPFLHEIIIIYQALQRAVTSSNDVLNLTVVDHAARFPLSNNARSSPKTTFGRSLTVFTTTWYG